MIGLSVAAQVWHFPEASKSLNDGIPPKWDSLNKSDLIELCEVRNVTMNLGRTQSRARTRCDTLFSPSSPSFATGTVSLDAPWLLNDPGNLPDLALFWAALKVPKRIALAVLDSPLWLDPPTNSQENPNYSGIWADWNVTSIDQRQRVGSAIFANVNLAVGYSLNNAETTRFFAELLDPAWDES